MGSLLIIYMCAVGGGSTVMYSPLKSYPTFTLVCLSLRVVSGCRGSRVGTLDFTLRELGLGTSDMQSGGGQHVTGTRQNINLNWSNKTGEKRKASRV